MFLRLKKPTFVLTGHEFATALPREVLLNIARIGTVSLGKTSKAVTFLEDQKNLGTPEPGSVDTIQIDIDGNLSELGMGGFAERRALLLFPQKYHGEYERIRRILEDRVIES